MPRERLAILEVIAGPEADERASENALLARE